MLKYSVEHSIEYYIRLEMKKIKICIWKKKKVLKIRFLLIYSERNSEKALGIILSVICRLLTDCLLRYVFKNESDNSFRMKYSMEIKKSQN
jgi:hypothetical protein